MSLTNEVPKTEAQVMKVMRNLFTSEYALEKPDRELVFRLMQYGKDKAGLDKEEITLLQNRGLMDKDETFLIPDEFWFRGLVTPSFWLKCLLAFHGLMDFNGLQGEAKK
jgi:hypothetical protein